MSAVRVELCSDGPVLVRGATEVDTEDGAVPVTRPVVALCRCGRSQRMPWCDSTHKFGPDGISRQNEKAESPPG